MDPQTTYPNEVTSTQIIQYTILHLFIGTEENKNCLEP